MSGQPDKVLAAAQIGNIYIGNFRVSLFLHAYPERHLCMYMMKSVN